MPEWDLSCLKGPNLTERNLTFLEESILPGRSLSCPSLKEFSCLREACIS